MKKILLSMILLALCLIQASADTYYYKIKLYNDNGGLEAWSKYIKVSLSQQQGDWVNGLRELVAGNPVTDEGDGNGNGTTTYQLRKKADGQVDLDRIYGIVFANGKGRSHNSTQVNQDDVKIMEGGEFAAWEKIRTHIKYLELREYELDTYTGSSYFANMHNVETLELPQCGMTVGNGVNWQYFSNADNLKKITIWNGSASVDITEYEGPVLQNSVGEYMFSNCYNLSTKYINRLIKNVTEIKANAFYADPGNRNKFPNETDNTIIDIPSTVTKIGNQAFYNRVKVTGLNIHGRNDGGLEIGSQAFRGCEQLHTLSLDNAKITSLGTGVFGDCRSMTNEFVNGVLENYAANANGEIKKIPAYLFFGCNGQNGFDGQKTVCSFTALNIPEQFSVIGDGAFASTGDAVIKLETITVNRVTAPTCLCEGKDKYADVGTKTVFDGVDPNITTVIFADNVQALYEENATTGVKTGFVSYMTDNSEFQRLLTKDIYSNHTEYINVKQQHAIVRLHRNLKVGWNTICLPFGVNYRYCSKWGENYKNKQAYNTRIIVNGLTNDDKEANSDNFTMGVYRGYWKDGKTFMFLHYTDFDTYPVDFCETFLVKMRSKDISQDGIYTFKNVDLNYRWSAKGESGNDGEWTFETYSAEEMLQQAKDFDGKVNTDAIPFKDKASYDDYVFRGSLVQRTGTVGDSQGIITTEDYFFQQSENGTMKLYPYKDKQKYGIRGFSGWFHYQTKNSNTKASELSLSLFDDGCTTPIETVKVDDLNRDTSGKVYSISGVLMKNNAADLNNLSKGIYVVNGKKYVVK